MLDDKKKSEKDYLFATNIGINCRRKRKRGYVFHLTQPLGLYLFLAAGTLATLTAFGALGAFATGAGRTLYIAFGLRQKHTA